MTIKSASGTEYVNAQLIELKDLIDYYAKKIENPLIPSKIKIIVPPTKKTYRDGETINLSGISVKYYDQFSHEMGVVPFKELKTKPKNADIKKIYEEDAATSDLDITPPFHKPLSFVHTNRITLYNPNGGISVDCIASSAGKAVGGSTFPSTEDGTWRNYFGVLANNNPFTVVDRDGKVSDALEYTYNGKKVYYYGFIQLGGRDYFVIPSTLYDVNYANDVSYYRNKYGPIAWTLIYGQIVGGKQRITVYWKPKGYKKTLTDKYSITVLP